MLIGYSIESDRVVVKLYIIGTWTGVLKSELYWKYHTLGVEKLNCCGWKVSKFVMEVLNEFEM